MATKKKSNSKEFKEFEFKGGNFKYSGRIYTESKREAGKLTITPMSLCLNGLITIKGCSFYETKDNMWVGFPQYKSGDDYKDYVFVDKACNDDLDGLAEVISETIG